MGPHLTLLLAALADCLCPVRPCIICDPFVVAALRTLEQSYLPSHLAPEHHQDVMKRVEEAVKDFKDLPLSQDTFVGAVGKEDRSGCRPWGPGRGRAGARSPGLGVTGAAHRHF